VTRVENPPLCSKRPRQHLSPIGLQPPGRRQCLLRLSSSGLLSGPPCRPSPPQSLPPVSNVEIAVRPVSAEESGIPPAPPVRSSLLAPPEEPAPDWAAPASGPLAERSATPALPSPSPAASRPPSGSQPRPAHTSRPSSPPGIPLAPLFLASGLPPPLAAVGPASSGRESERSVPAAIPLAAAATGAPQADPQPRPGEAGPPPTPQDQQPTPP